MNAHGLVLRDIHVPHAAWWPLAPGWWLAAVAVLLLLAGIGWWWRRRASGSTLAVALHEIDVMASAYAIDCDARRVVESASRLLRRVAVRVQPAVASQGGNAWRDFVHRHARDAATRRILDQMIDARFRAQPELEVPMLLAALRSWCVDALRARSPRHGLKRIRARTPA